MLLCIIIVIMNTTLTSLRNYFVELGGEPPEVLPDEEAKTRLPVFLSQLYEPYQATLFGRHLRLLVSKRREPPTPAELESHAKLLGQKLGIDVAFVFKALPSFDRNRLLKRRVPFIVPHRQMFLPGQMIDLRETHSPATGREASKPLSMPAQLLFLYQLQKRPDDVPFPLYEWAMALGYSRMSITRAHRELVDAELAEATRPHKSVMLRFIGNRRSLWEKALPILRSPVMKKGNYVLKDMRQPFLLDAGLTALAHYTDISEGRRTLATGRLFWKAQSACEQVPFAEVDTVLIEQWWYPPAVLSEDTKVVDRLSLYLSLRNDPDERVQAALAQLLEGVKW
jgi:hypothetical protein